MCGESEQNFMYFEGYWAHRKANKINSKINLPIYLFTFYFKLKFDV